MLARVFQGFLKVEKLERVLDLIPITGLQSPPPECRTLLSYRRSRFGKQSFGTREIAATGFPSYSSTWRTKVLKKKRYANRKVCSKR